MRHNHKLLASPAKKQETPPGGWPATKQDAPADHTEKFTDFDLPANRIKSGQIPKYPEPICQYWA